MPELSLPRPALRDEVVHLRGWRIDDAPALYAAFSDPTVQRCFWHLARPFTEADAQAALTAVMEGQAGDTELGLAAVTPDAQGLLLGGVSLHTVDQVQGRGAVGFWLGPHARGRGVATRSVQLLARWAFTTLGLARLELTCAPDNVASQRVAERCGFVREGLLRSHMLFKGERRDTLMFSLLPDEARPVQSLFR